MTTTAVANEPPIMMMTSMDVSSANIMRKADTIPQQQHHHQHQQQQQQQQIHSSHSDGELLYNIQLRCGFLSKKRKFGWHKRYFVLTPLTISYYNGPHDPFPSGYVSLREIDRLIYSPEKKGGRQLQLELCYGKVIQLMTECRTTAIEWVASFEQALIALHKRVRNEKKIGHQQQQQQQPPTTKPMVAGAANEEAWQSSDFAEALDEYAQTQFRLEFYKVARNDPQFLHLLMTKYRSEESMMYLLIQILISQHSGGGGGGGGGGGSGTTSASSSASSNMLSRGTSDTSPPTPTTTTTTTTTTKEHRSSGCSRFNPLVHSSTLLYNRTTMLDIDIIPAFSTRARRPSIVGRSPSSVQLSVSTRTLPTMPSPSRTPPNSTRITRTMSHDQGQAYSSSASLSSQPPPPPMVKRASRRMPSVAYSLMIPENRAVYTVATETRSADNSPSPLRSIGEESNTATTSSSTAKRNAHSRRASESEFALSYLDIAASPLSHSAATRRRSRRTSSNYEVIVDLRSRNTDASTTTTTTTTATRSHHSRSSASSSSSMMASAAAAVGEVSLSTFDEISEGNRQRLYDWLVSDAFLETVCHVFTSSEWEAQRLALRVVWLLLQRHNHQMLSVVTPDQHTADGFPIECPECHDSSKQFVQFVEKILTGYVSSRALNYQVNNLVNGLLYILLTDVADFCSDATTRGGHSSAMGRNVRNYGVWEVVFRCLAHSEFHTRRRALKDINVCLINRGDNCESLMSLSGWQQFLLPLLIDIPQNMESTLLQKTYYYTINIFTLLHYHSFVHYADTCMGFQSVMRTSLLSVLEVGDNQIHMMRSMFSSLMKKLRFHHQSHCMFDVVFDGCVWMNLRHLLKFVSAFLFLTPPRDVHARLDDLYSNETRYGVHAKQDIAHDMDLIEVALELLAAVHLSKLELLAADVIDSTTVEAEQQAFIAVKAAEYDQFFHDSMVFLPILHSLNLTDDEIGETVRDFLLAGNGHARKKVFKDAKSRNAEVQRKRADVERARSKTLDAQLKRDHQRQSDRVFNLLLLGTGESGKSTLFKQIINLYGCGFSESMRVEYKPIIFENVVSSMHTLCEESVRLGFSMQDEESERIRQSLLDLEAPYTLDTTIATHISHLWSTSAIFNTYARRSSFQLPCGDSASYFFESVGRLAMQAYVPSFNDVLHCRLRTKGISEALFTIDRVKMRVMDVGGQRSERKKWIHYFEDVTSVIFVCAMSEYDQVLAEDGTANRFRESLHLFETLVPMFKHKSIILFLNKSDLFRSKIRHARSLLTNYFPDFHTQGAAGSDEEYRDACNYMAALFHKRVRVKTDIFIHITCATDTNQVQHIFNDVKTTIIEQSLQDSGLV